MVSLLRAASSPMRTASMSKPLVLRVRNSCSIAQRRRYRSATAKASAASATGSVVRSRQCTPSPAGGSTSRTSTRLRTTLFGRPVRTPTVGRASSTAMKRTATSASRAGRPGFAGSLSRAVRPRRERPPARTAARRRRGLLGQRPRARADRRPASRARTPAVRAAASAAISSTVTAGLRRKRVRRISPARLAPSRRTRTPRPPVSTRRACRNAPLFPGGGRQTAPAKAPSPDPPSRHDRESDIASPLKPKCVNAVALAGEVATASAVRVRANRRTLSSPQLSPACGREFALPIRFLAAGLALEIHARDLLDVVLDPLPHALLFLERLAERGHELDVAGRLGHGDERLVGRDLEGLEGVVGEGVLQDLVGDRHVRDGRHVPHDLRRPILKERTVLAERMQDLVDPLLLAVGLIEVHAELLRDLRIVRHPFDLPRQDLPRLLLERVGVLDAGDEEGLQRLFSAGAEIGEGRGNGHGVLPVLSGWPVNEKGTAEVPRSISAVSSEPQIPLVFRRLSCIDASSRAGISRRDAFLATALDDIPARPLSEADGPRAGLLRTPTRKEARCRSRRSARPRSSRNMGISPATPGRPRSRSQS